MAHALADRRVDRAPADGAVPVDTQLAQFADDLLHALADQVDLEQVAAGRAGDARQNDDVGRPWLTAQYRLDLRAEVGRAYHAHMQQRHAA